MVGHRVFVFDAARLFGLCLIAAAAVCSPRPAHAQTRLAEYVNTLRGTNSSREFSRGATFPAVTMPFGFNFWTPFTEGNSQRALYVYGRRTVQGFGVSHEPSPAIRDHGSIQMMPQVGAVKVAPEARAAAFQHSREVARPYYYSVDLESPAIRVEFTPTDHAARFRYTYPRSEQSILLFDSIDSVTGEIRVLSESGELEGSVDHNGPRLYFAAHVDAPIRGVEYPQHAGVAAAIRFDTRSNPVVNVRIGTSFISLAQARSNLEAEVGTRSFEELREAAARAWDEKLGLIEVEGASERQRITLYSNLYRAFMYPNSMWERAGEEARYFSPYDDQVHTGKIWVNNGFWDTYRAAWPLYVLLCPAQAGEMLQGFVHAYLDGGWTPRWSGPGYRDSMVGSHADSVFADAYLKGVRGFDVQAAYTSMLKNALVAAPKSGGRGRKENEVFNFTGYVPTSAITGSLAWSLENYVNDYNISQLATALGDRPHAEYFRSRAFAYIDMFSPSVGFFRGRTADGSWRTPDAEFRANEWGYEYVEGNAWHYSMAANHDPEGMARLYGGRGALAAKIDAMISAPRDFLRGSYRNVSHEMAEAYASNFGQYAHANQPAHHILYMYNYAATPWKTQAAVREVLRESRGIYGPGIGDGGGYLGDEDNGQMSAWFIFSALGFYPASPGHAEYAIGSPLFTRAIIHLPGDKTFTVSAPGNSDAHPYVQSARLNGLPLSRNYLKHAEIVAGGELVLEMGAAPSRWGSQPEDVPTSLSQPGQTPNRLRDHSRGGVVRASGRQGLYAATAVFDDDSRTEWRPGETPAWVDTRCAEGKTFAARYYTLTSGKINARNDPRAWTLMTSEDGEHWDTLDVRSDEKFEWRRQTRVFEIKAPRRAAYHRLLIQGTASDAPVHLAELELLSDDP